MPQKKLLKRDLIPDLAEGVSVREREGAGWVLNVRSEPYKSSGLRGIIKAEAEAKYVLNHVCCGYDYNSGAYLVKVRSV